MERHKIHIYEFPDCDSDEDEDFKRQDSDMKVSNSPTILCKVRNSFRHHFLNSLHYNNQKRMKIIYISYKMQKNEKVFSSLKNICLFELILGRHLKGNN